LERRALLGGKYRKIGRAMFGAPSANRFWRGLNGCVNNGNGWLAAFFAGVRFTVMKCPVKLRSVKLGLFLAAPLSEATRWIQCRGCKCLAIVDKSGKWRCFATGEDLKVKCA